MSTPSGTIIRSNGIAFRVLGKVENEYAAVIMDSKQMTTLSEGQVRCARILAPPSSRWKRRIHMRKKSETATPTVTAASKRTAKQKQKSLYLACVGDRVYKIGQTFHLKKRLTALQICSVDKIRLVREWKETPKRASKFETAVKRRIRKRSTGGGTEVFRARNDSSAVTFVNRHIRKLT